MGERMFHKESRPGGVVEEWFSTPEGHISRRLRQDAEGIVGAVKALADNGGARGKAQYLLGSVPIVEAELWANECGHGIGTRDWLDYAKKKLMSNEFSRLSTGIKI